MKAFFVGLQFLTRLKLVNQTNWDLKDFGRSVMYFPIVGAVIGFFLWLIYFILGAHVPMGLLAILLVAFEFFFTGGLHADGFMDTCDGLFSGRDRERKLEIMKDSRVGSNAVMGFVFLALLKWQALVQVSPEYVPWVLFFMPLLSRYSLSISVKAFPYARKEGMGKAFAVYSPKCTLLVATILALIPLLHWSTAAFYFASFVGYIIVNVVINSYITKHLGGVTGDTYGFVIEVSELLYLIAVVIAQSFM